MLSKTLKAAAGKVFDPLAKILGQIGVKPNHITVTGVALTMYAALVVIPSECLSRLFGRNDCLFV